MSTHARTLTTIILLTLTVAWVGGCENGNDMDDDTAKAMELSSRTPNAKEVVAAEPYYPDLKPAEEAMKIGRRDEFKQMEALLELDGKQKKEFNQAVASRAEKLQEWNDSDFHEEYTEAKMELKAARKAGDEEEVAELQKKLEPMDDKQWAFKEKIRAQVIDQLTPAQRKGWTGYVLWEKVIGRFRRADITDDQKLKALHACVDVADRQLFAKGDITQVDPYLESIYPLRVQAQQKITDEILTDQQREEMPKKK